MRPHAPDKAVALIKMHVVPGARDGFQFRRRKKLPDQREIVLPDETGFLPAQEQGRARPCHLARRRNLLK